MTESELLIDDVEMRVDRIYEKALRTALKRQKKFLKIMDDIDKCKVPIPQWYVDRGMEAEYLAGYARAALREQGVINACAKELAIAGKEASKEIQGSLVKMYDVTRKAEIGFIKKGCAAIGYNPTFYVYDRRLMFNLVSQIQPPFSKIAYASLGNEKIISRKLESAFGDAIMRGTGRDSLVARTKDALYGANKITSETIQNAKATGASDEAIKALQKTAERQTSRARTICQTEMTRIESEAQYDADQEAIDQGIEMEREWHCRFQNSRESHMDMEGQVVADDEDFISGDGVHLRFPADPSAPPEEVINCHCEVTRRVKSHSEALARHREEFRKKREQWVKNAGKDNNWRGEGSWR